MKILALKSVALLLSFVMTLARAQQFSEEVITLDQGNFDTAMDTESIWVIAFFVPFCEHTTAFAPKLEAAVKDLQANGYSVKMGAVDVESNMELGWRYQVDKSPTTKIFFYSDGEWTDTNYVGEQEQEMFSEYAAEFYKEKKADIPFSNLSEEFIEGEIIELDSSNFADTVYNSNEIWMLKFSAPWCYHCNQMKPSWIAAAKELGSNVRFAVIDAAANRDLAKDFGVTMLPTLKFFKAGYGDRSADLAHKYSGTRDLYSMATFAKGLRSEYEQDPSAFNYESDVEFDTSTKTDAPMPSYFVKSLQLTEPKPEPVVVVEEPVQEVEQQEAAETYDISELLFDELVFDDPVLVEDVEEVEQPEQVVINTDTSSIQDLFFSDTTDLEEPVIEESDSEVIAQETMDMDHGDMDMDMADCLFATAEAAEAELEDGQDNVTDPGCEIEMPEEDEEVDVGEDDLTNWLLKGDGADGDETKKAKNTNIYADSEQIFTLNTDDFAKPDPVQDNEDQESAKTEETLESSLEMHMDMDMNHGDIEMDMTDMAECPLAAAMAAEKAAFLNGDDQGEVAECDLPWDSEILTITNVLDRLQVSEDNIASQDETKTVEPKAEEPENEEKKAVETKSEEPKAEESEAVEPKADEPKAEEPKSEEAQTEEPKAEEPKTEEPKTEEPKAEEPKAEKPKADDKEAKQESEESLPAAQVATTSGPQVHENHGLPDEITDLCVGHVLCVVAFLDEDNNNLDNHLMVLHAAAAFWDDYDVKFFWVEAGENEECESILQLSYSDAAVIAFASSSNKFMTMDTEIHSENLNGFIRQCEESGLEWGLDLPEGGIQVY